VRAERDELTVAERVLERMSAPVMARQVGRHLRPRLFEPLHHEHACVRCSLPRPDPVQRGRLDEIRDNLVARIAEAEREGWLGEVENSGSA
jgi:hypothetical protein